MKYKKRKVLLILDGHPTHTSKEVKDYLNRLEGKLEFYFLLPYSPDLNRDEFEWNYLKHKSLARKFIGSKEKIEDTVKMCIDEIKRNIKLICSFLQLNL